MANIRDDVAVIRRRMGALSRGELTRREFMLLTAGASATAILAACNAETASPVASQAQGSVAPGSALPSTAPPAGTRRIVPLYTTESDPATLAFYSAAITEFRTEFPDVDVPITLYKDETRVAFLTTAFETDTDVGIFNPPASNVAGWAQAGLLLPLGPLVESVGADDFLPGVRVRLGGEDYGMPVQAGNTLLWYRKDLLSAAGLEPPTTHEALVGALSELHGQEGRIGIAQPVGPTATLPINFLTPYLHQSGWSYFSKEGEIRFNEPELFEGVQRFVEVMRYTSESFYNAGFGDILTAYLAGQAAFAVYPGRLGVNLETQAPNIAEVTDVLPIPAGPFMNGQLHFGGTGFQCIYANTRYPDEALAFLEALRTGENALAFSLTVPGHLLPPLKSVQDALRQSDDPYVAKYRDRINLMCDLVPTAVDPTYGMGSCDDHQFEKIGNICPFSHLIWTSPPIDGVMLQEILINNRNAEEAWTDAHTKMAAAANQWLSENPDWTPTA